MGLIFSIGSSSISFFWQSIYYYDTSGWLTSMIILLQTTGYKISAASLPSFNRWHTFYEARWFHPEDVSLTSFFFLLFHNLYLAMFTSKFQDTFNCSVTLSIKILWHWVPQSWQADYLISDHFSTQSSGAENLLTRILNRGTTRR